MLPLFCSTQWQRMERQDQKRRSKKNLKQLVFVLTCYTEMKGQVVILIFITDILFGESSLLPLGLKSLYNTIMKCSSELKHKTKAKNLLPANSVCCRLRYSTLAERVQDV